MTGSPDDSHEDGQPESSGTVEAEALLDGFPFAALVVEDGDVVAANEAARELFGGRGNLTEVAFDRLVPDGIDADPAPSRDSPDFDVVSARSLDGEEIELAITSRRVEASTGERVLCTAFEVGRLRELAADVQPGSPPDDEELRQFIDGVSHDLKHPLSIIQGRLQLLEQAAGDALDAESREHLEEASDGVERAERLLDSLSTYARVTRGDGETEPVDLDEVLEEAIANVSSSPGRDVEIETEPLATVSGNRTALIQLFQNLVANGLEYQDEPPYRVSVYGDHVDGTYRVTVEDNGVGIDPDEQDDIFQPFERGRSSEGTQGDGLGLALCKRVVDEIGGRITVESTPGVGSKFHVFLPTPEESTSQDEEEQADEAAAAPEQESDGAAEPMSVVLVDDVDGIRSLMGSILEKTGRYEVVGEAGSGEEGIRVAADEQPELVLLDLSMPEMDGLEALPRIQEESSDTEVVIYSGFEKDRMAETALERGAAGYIEKGGDPEDIIEQLEDALSERTAMSIRN